MISKYFKYLLLLEAEIISQAAKKIQEATESFVIENSDKDYEETLSNVFDEIEGKIRKFSPEIEKVTTSIEHFKKNVIPFPKRS